jgi:site-specific DNA-methyltransferase (adenine-specific)
MAPYTLHLGDCLEVMRAMPDNSIDAIVTDPPYHLTTGKKGGSGPASYNPDSPAGCAKIGTGFMGMTWDGGDIAFRVELWREALRVLKPGGHVLAFSGSRTYHRMACAIEDAGFEIRDQILWVYLTGFPKSRDIAKYDMDGADAAAWAGWGTGLKPTHEPICMARKPLAKGMTVAANVLAHGTGALNIDACRVEVLDDDYARNCSGDRGHGGTRSAAQAGATNLHTGGGSAAAGRWPANLVHDGSDDVVALFPAQAGAAAPVHTRRADKFRNSYGSFAGNIDEAGSTFRGDAGSAARFFYCAKASRRDRNEGCEQLAAKPLHWSSGDQNPGSFQSAGTDKSSQNFHPTVKPTALMQWLVRLVTPPGGVVLDLFTGSGSTGKACMRERLRFIGAELNPDYLAIAEVRIGHALAAREAAARAAAPASPQIDLFA